MPATSAAGGSLGWYAGGEEAALDPADDLNSGLRALPVVAWASRFRCGHSVLQGQAAAARVTVAGLQLELTGGPTRVELAFAAGPQLTHLAVEGRLQVEGEETRRLELQPGLACVDGVERPCGARLDLLLEALVGHLSDVHAAAQALPDGELLVRFGTGLEVSIPASATLAVQGATVGGPDALRLSAPLVISVDGAHLRFGQRQLRWLGALARVRVHRATLHPDGSVHIEGGGRTGLDGAVRSGLHQVSARLSALVRSSPRFARVRAFLHP